MDLKSMKRIRLCDSQNLSRPMLAWARPPVLPDDIIQRFQMN